MDENGTLRTAEGYEGNIEEGLARYEAAHGRTHPIGTTDSPGAIGNNEIPPVPNEAACGLGGAGAGGILERPIYRVRSIPGKA